MLGVVITTDTMKSKNLITTFGKKVISTYQMYHRQWRIWQEKTRADLAKELDDLAEELPEEGMPSEMSVEIQYTIKINFYSFI